MRVAVLLILTACLGQAPLVYAAGGDAGSTAASESASALQSNPGTPQSSPSGSRDVAAQRNNNLSSQGIMSSSSGHGKPGLITGALGGVVSDAGHATLALLGATIIHQSGDLPPDDDSAPQWPFKEPKRKAIYTVCWQDGSSANISRLPDGSLQILGSGRRYMLQPDGDGSFALFGDYGTMASVTPRPGGGYTILKADGDAEQVIPVDGGGYVLEGSRGVLARILPGVGGSRHVIRGNGYSSGTIF